MNYDFNIFMREFEWKRRTGQMGGCGGKKRRERAKQVAATIDANFNSTGDVEDQGKNRELVLRLIPDIRPHVTRLTFNDQQFIKDCLIKMNQMGSTVIFGWRQVQKMVAIHKGVTDGSYWAADGLPGNASGSGAGETSGAGEARDASGRDGTLVPSSPGGVRGSHRGDGGTVSRGTTRKV